MVFRVVKISWRLICDREHPGGYKELIAEYYDTSLLEVPLDSQLEWSLAGEVDEWVGMFGDAEEEAQSRSDVGPAVKAAEKEKKRIKKKNPPSPLERRLGTLGALRATSARAEANGGAEQEEPGRSSEKAT